MILTVRHLQRTPYSVALAQMQACVKNADHHRDQIWLLEHPPVYTQGIAGKAQHMLAPSPIPLIQSDRGGQITYHGPGQLIIYTLLNLTSLKLNSKEFVHKLETVVQATLQHWQINSHRVQNSPGVFVNNCKIASIGLRIRKGICYHGIALNVAMDLKPFTAINPCGYAQLQMCQMRDWVPNIDIDRVKPQFCRDFCRHFGYTQWQNMTVEDTVDEPV